MNLKLLKDLPGAKAGKESDFGIYGGEIEIDCVRYNLQQLIDEGFIELIK